MAHVEPGPNWAPSSQTIEMVRERLQHMGARVTEDAVRSLVSSVLAIEAPRLYARASGTLENSLEIIRDTAESALTAMKGQRGVPDPTPRPIARRRPVEEPEEPNPKDPRPVFKRRR